jgi:transposase
VPPLPGIGQILRLVLRDASHAIHRFPRGPDLASYAPLVKCRQAAGGKGVGPAGTKIGNAPLTWAFAAAAPWVLRPNEAGQTYLARVAQQHATGTALRILAQTLGRAVSYRLKRQGAFARASGLQAAGSRAGEPSVALDTDRDAPAASLPSV